MAFHRHFNFHTMISSAFLLLLLIAFSFPSHAEIPPEVAKKIERINSKGEYYGLVVSGKAELTAVLDEVYGIFRPDRSFVDVSARRFHVGMIEGCKSIVVMSGSGMVNAAQTTQLLLSLFRVKGVVFYGRGGSANPNKLNIGDISVPRQIAHVGRWYWEKFGGDEGRFDRDIANLTFSNFNVGEKKVANKLQTVYLQREEIYSVNGEPENGTPKFFYNVDEYLYRTAESLKDVDLAQCRRERIYPGCLKEKPKIKAVEKASSSNIYVNNKAYRDFQHSQLDITSIDIDSAAIAMVSESENKPFITMISTTNHAGGSSPQNDMMVIGYLWPRHARTTIQKFFYRLSLPRSNLRTVTGTQM